MVGTGQFDGAGSSDILLQNVDGQASIWDMAGNAITGGGQVELHNPGQGWRAVGTGDFNHDGTSDILWQNTSTGAVSIWNMGGTGGTTVESGGPVNSGGVPVIPGADWKAIGTGNFSGDGFADDIILQNTATSQVSIWNIGPGETLTGGGAVATPGTGWSAIGSDGGGSEILLQNTNGQTSIWDMSGTTIAGGGPTSADPGPNWAAVGLAGHAILSRAGASLRRLSHAAGREPKPRRAPPSRLEGRSRSHRRWGPERCSKHRACARRLRTRSGNWRRSVVPMRHSP